MKNVLLALTAVLAAGTAAHAETAAEFYKGKTVRIIVGVGVGSAFHPAGQTGFDGLVRITPDGKIHIHTGVGNLGQAILASAPVGARAQLEPFVPAIVEAIHRAFSLATASTFLFGIVGAVVAIVVVLFLREAPARASARSRSGAEASIAGAEAAE